MRRHEMDPLVSGTGLEKTYASNGTAVHALRGVDIAASSGEFVAIMGPSGCGKSTLLYLLGGLDRPSAGQVRLEGARVDELSETRWAVLRRHSIGFVFQFFNLIGNLTAADNVELPGLLAGQSPAEVRRRREELFEDLGIAGQAETVPSQLSGGQQQRVALARALINRPSVLLADEPTGNLDSASARDLMDLLRRHHERGQTIVLVTHDARVASAADRVVYLRDGQVCDETRMGPAHDTAKVVSDLMRLEV